MILTNKCEVTYNFENIQRDFDIYMVTKESAKLDRTNILDYPTSKFKARAVQYSFGRNAYVLFAKGEVKESEFRNELQREYHDVKVVKVNVLDENFCKDHFFYQNRLLAQLLINSMRAPKSDLFAYNNLTGKLFYTDVSWKILDKETKQINIMYFLEISFDPGMYLNLDVKTFRRSSYAKNGRIYIFDPKTKIFRKKLSNDPEVATFVEGSFKNRHITVDYLDFSSFKKFKCCKLGILQKFLNDIKENLGNYMKVELGSVDESNAFILAKELKAELSIKELGEIIKKRGISIEDYNNTQESQELVKNLIYELSRYYGVEPEVGCTNDGGYNIRVIHNKEYYEERELEDPHQYGVNGLIIQHMNEEQNHFTEKDAASPAVNKVIQELIMKGDVIDGKISIFDWSKMGTSKCWTFVIREKIDQGFVENKSSWLNSVGEKTFNNFRYYYLRITPDGQIEFGNFTDECISNNPMQEKIIFAYEKFTKDERGARNEVEGLAFSDIDNIHAIILTRERTMPNIEALWNGLQETEGKAIVDREELLEALELFSETGDAWKEYCDFLREKLCLIEENHITKETVRKAMDFVHYKKAAKQFNRYMHDNFGIWISPEIKDQAFESEYMLENVLNIKYFEKRDSTHETQTFYYFVGTKRPQLQSSIHNACTVRKVLTLGNSMEFHDLLPLMAVEFVRNNQYTVLPFPFKYLREYSNIV